MKYVGKNGLRVENNEVWHEGNLEIGGRNLIRETTWGNYGNGIVTVNNGIIKVVSTRTSSGYSGIQQTGSIKFTLEAGQLYTLSFKARGTINRLNYVYIMNSSGNNQRISFDAVTSVYVTSSSKFETFIFTFTPSANTAGNNSHLMISGPSLSPEWFEIKDIKLEKGTIPTDWTPAPEDIQEQIDKKWEYDENTIKNVKVDKSKDTDTVNGKTVAVNVPSDAKFTDTVTTINGKTGTITKADITALGIPAQDTVYTHPTTAGNKHIPTGGASGQFLKWSANGTATWDSVPGGLSLGETSGTAYRGDRGKVAYDHSQNAAVHIKTVTSATEPSNLNAGDQWHKEI